MKIRSDGVVAARPILSTLLRLIRREAIPLGAVFILSLATTALSLAQPLLTRHLIDDGLLADDMHTVLVLCSVMVGLGIASSLAGLANRWLYVASSGRILFSLRETVYRHLQAWSPAQFSRTSGGDLMTRLDGDVAEIQRFGVDAPLAFMNGVLALTGALVVMLSLSWQLSLLAFVLLPVEILFLWAWQPRIKRETQRLRGRADDIASFFMDGLPAMKFIQSVNAEAREADRLHALDRAYLGDLLRLQVTNYGAVAVPGLLVLISTAAVFVMGGAQVIENTLSLGSLIAFSAYLARATGPVQTLLGLYVGFTRMRVSLNRILELTTVPPAIAAAANPHPMPRDGAGELVLDGVSFRFGPDRPAILENASLVVKGGMKVGLIGPSGAGKTTAIDLLHRHYDPTAGRILLDGVDFRDLDLGALRRRIAVVGQDTFLMAGTLADNVRFAAPGASDAEVRAAVRLAQLDQFVAELPDGLETRVGWRGADLSGGQRQRVAIARALLQDPLVLILDEATSAVDLDAEAQIVAAIDDLFIGRTRIVISHRPGALLGCDRVVRMARGLFEPLDLADKEEGAEVLQ